MSVNPLTITSIGELIASLPAVLGHFTKDSFVVLGHSSTTGSVFTAQFAFDNADDCVVKFSRVFKSVQHRGIDAFGVFVVTDNVDTNDDLPERSRVEEIIAQGTAAGLQVTCAVWAPKISKGAQWRSYESRMWTGILPDPYSTALAVAKVAAGEQIWPSRDDATKALEPIDEETLSRRAALIQAYQATMDTHAQRGLALIHEVVKERDPASLTDEEFAAIACALCDYDVRDSCLRFALDEHAGRARNLWATLVPGLPAPERAEPAMLLAYTDLMRGDDFLANIALDRALDADPDHTLAGLMCRAVIAGVSRENLARLADI